MRILRILKGTTVDGPGFRTSVYFAGCAHHCAGCHNPGSWDFTGGEDTSIDQLMETVEEEDFDVTLSGGDPLYQPEDVAELCRRVARLGHTVWIYTGFTWEEILSDPRLLDAVRHAEVVVDSPFIESLLDRDLLFRGSSNQRLIRVSESLTTGKIVLWHSR